MSGLQIVVTDAGRAALVSADNLGTLPVTVAQVGVTSTAFTANPDGSDVALPGEVKRLATIAGSVVAEDTIHVTIQDNSADSYSVRGVGLYLADGTLFALYGQAGVILEKSSLATMLLSADITFVDILATSLTFGDASSNPPATTEVQGVTEHATDAEALTGIDPARSITAKALRYVLDSRFGAGAPSAFVKGLLNLATAIAIRAALEIKSAALKDEGAGYGLDADLLDGQHGAHYLAWGNLTGKPTTFTPSAHAHAWGDITGAPDTATRWPAWAEVSDKPLTFTPAPHSHAASDIVSGEFAAARISQASVKQYEAALSIAWSQLTGKPLTFAPSAHTHATGDITGLTAFVNGLISAALVNYLPKNNPTFTGIMTGPAYNET